MKKNLYKINAFYFLTLLLFLSSCAGQKNFKATTNEIMAKQFYHAENKSEDVALRKNHISHAEKMLPAGPKLHALKNRVKQKIENKTEKIADNIEENSKKFSRILTQIPSLQKATVKKEPVWQVTWKDVVFFIVWLLILSVLVLLARMFGIGPFVYLMACAILTVIVIGIYVYWNQNPSYPRY